MNKWILALSLFGAFRLLPKNIPEIGDSIQDTELSCWPILVQCHISIPPENVWFSGGVEMWHWTKMG